MTIEDLHATNTPEARIAFTAVAWLSARDEGAHHHPQWTLDRLDEAAAELFKGHHEPNEREDDGR